MKSKKEILNIFFDVSFDFKELFAWLVYTKMYYNNDTD